MTKYVRRTRALACIAVGGLVAALGAGAPALAAPDGPGASGWHLGYYTPSGRALSNAQAAPSADGIATFNFTDQPNTALLVTDKNGPLTGDLNGKTLNASGTVTGATGAFTYEGEGTPSNPCGTPANFRFFFQTSNAGGFQYWHYWWSNPVSAVLTNGTWTLTAPVDPADWSDWNGQPGTTVPQFSQAAANVTSVGLSYGGGCFFENGVGTTDGSGTFDLQGFSAS